MHLGQKRFNLPARGINCPVCGVSYHVRSVNVNFLALAANLAAMLAFVLLVIVLARFELSIYHGRYTHPPHHVFGDTLPTILLHHGRRCIRHCSSRSRIASLVFSCSAAELSIS
jgi:hypothetical protein